MRRRALLAAELSGLRADALAASFADQSAEDLRLTLCGGPLEASQFRLLDTAAIERPGLRARAHVIGASHWVAIECALARDEDDGERLRLNEVLACGEVRQTGPVLHRGLVWPGTGKLGFEPCPGVGYEFEATVARGEEGRASLAALSRRVAEPGPGACGAIYRFPSDPAVCGPSQGRGPVTVVWMQADVPGHVLELRTAHGYPAERCVVLSRSMLRVERRGRSGVEGEA